MGFDATAATGHRPVLHDKVAVITGGAHGIGRAAVHLFVEAGARVVTCDVDAHALDELSADLGDDVVAVRADVGTRDGVGALSDSFLLVHETPYEIFEKTLQINTWSTFAMTHDTLPLMQGRPASIINVASVYALVAGAGACRTSRRRAPCWR